MAAFVPPASVQSVTKAHDAMAVDSSEMGKSGMSLGALEKTMPSFHKEANKQDKS